MKLAPQQVIDYTMQDVNKQIVTEGVARPVPLLNHGWLAAGGVSVTRSPSTMQLYNVRPT